MTNIYRFMSSEICIAVSSSSISLRLKLKNSTSSISLRLKLKNSTVGPYFLPWSSANVSYSRVCTDFWIHNSRIFPYFFLKTIISFSRLQVIGDLTYHSSLAGTKHTRKHHSFFLVLKSKTKLAYFPSCSGYFVYFSREINLISICSLNVPTSWSLSLFISSGFLSLRSSFSSRTKENNVKQGLHHFRGGARKNTMVQRHAEITSHAQSRPLPRWGGEGQLYIG